MKPTDVENSKSRKEERGSPIGFEWLADSRERLGDPVVIDGLLRDMFGKIATARAEYNADKIEGGEAASLIAAAALELAATFNGKNDQFQTMAWFDPKILGARLCEQGFGDDPEKSVHAMLLDGCMRVLNSIMEHEAGVLQDEDVSWRIECIIDDSMEYLLGMSLDKLTASDPFEE